MRRNPCRPRAQGSPRSHGKPIDRNRAKLCRSRPHHHGLRGPYMYPCEISREGKLFCAVAAARASLGLTPPETLYSHSALDAGFLVAPGCEAAMWGPGRMELFHTDEE